MSSFKQFIQNKWFWIGTAVCLLIAVYTYFFRIPFLKVNPIEAVSKDAAFILDAKEETLYTLAQSYPFLQETSPLLQSLDSIFQISATEQSTIAGFIHPRSGIDLLYIFDNENIKKEITSEYNISKSEFKGIEVFHLQIDNQAISFCTYQNLTFAAEKAFIVEDAIRQLEDKQNSLLSDNSFRSIWEKTPNQKSHLYFQLSKFAEVIASSSDISKHLGVQSLVEKTPWIATNLSSTKSYINLEPMTSNRSNLEENIPENALFYTSIPFIANSNFNWSATEASLVMTAPSNTTWQNNIHLLIPFENEEEVNTSLTLFAEQEGQVDAVPYLNYEINRLPQIHPFDFLFGAEYYGLNKPFYTILDNYVLFSNDFFTHQRYLDKILNSQTLSSSIEYLQFKEKHLSKGNTACFLSEKGLQEWLKSNLRQDLFNTFFAQKKSFAYVHFYPNKKHYDIKKSLSSKPKDELKMTWKQRLDTKGLRQPYFVSVPSSNQSYLFVQDESYQLYCFDTEGRLIWKKAMEEAILSDFFLVDYQKNKQYQILFNTENKIHLLDFNGKNIGRYPVDFRSKASNGLICFDKDGHQNFVYFLAGKNKKLYGYELNGRPLQGWNPKETKYLIARNGLYFFDDKKDYISFVDQNNQLHSFDLKGTAHFEAVNLGAFLGELAFDTDAKAKRFIVLKPDGRFKIINLSGATFNLATTSQSSVVDFDFADITGDTRKDYVVLAGKQLLVYSYNEDNKFKKSFDYTFDFPQEKVFTFQEKAQSKQSIATLDNTNKEVNVLSSKGKPLDGFPIEATTPFDAINQKGKLYLSVLKGKEVRFYQK